MSRRGRVWAWLPGMWLLAATAACRAAPPAASSQAAPAATPPLAAAAVVAQAAPTRPADTPTPVPSPTLAPTPVPWWAQATLPDWVRTTRVAERWAGDVRPGAPGEPVPPNVPLQVIGPAMGDQLLVYDAGDGGADGGGRLWVNARAVEPIERPGWVTGSTGVAAPRRKGAAGGPTPPPRGTPVAAVAPDAPHITAAQAVVVDEASGRVLLDLKAHEHAAPASVTKIITTLVALQRAADLSQPITATISATALVNLDGSSTMGLEPGDQVSLRTLLYGMMLPSGNDAAEQTAASLGGSRQQYVAWMNDELAALGLKDSHFVTPSGMDAVGHYSSPYDLAMAARYAMRNATFRTIVTTPVYKGDGFFLHMINPLLGVYPGADGVKIGYTDAAGRTMVASDTRDGHRVYVTVMHSLDLGGDTRKLFDWVWQTFEW